MPIDFNYSGIQQSLTINEVTGLQADLDLKAPIESPAFSGTVSGVTKAMVGLSEVENTSDADKPISDTTLQALNLKAPIDNPEFTGTVAGVTKSMVGLGNVDDVSDINKVVSNATQTALNLKQNLLNTSNLFLDTSVENQPKLGLGTSTPSSTSGGDTLFQIFGQTDCALSIKRGGGGDWEFKCNNPSGSLSVYNGGSHRAEWTNTEFELKQGLTVKGAVVDMESLPTSAQTGTTKLWNNSGALNIGAGASGGGGGGSSILKEYFSRYCFGQTVTTTNGNITLPNITAAQNITGSILNGWVDLTGSEISYQPPSGSTIVEYELDFYATCPGNDSENGFQMSFSIDGTEQSITRAKCNLSNLIDGKRGQTRYKFKTIIEINGTTDADKGFLSTWASAKTLKLRVMRILDKDLRMHEVTTFYKENPLAVVNTIVAPNLKICAY